MLMYSLEQLAWDMNVWQFTQIHSSLAAQGVDLLVLFARVLYYNEYHEIVHCCPTR